MLIAMKTESSIFMLFTYLLSLFMEVRSYCLLGSLGDLNICGISGVLEAL